MTKSGGAANVQHKNKFNALFCSHLKNKISGTA